MRNRIPPALKHAAYSATAVLPGESRAAFEKLHRDLIAELNPSGVLEDDIIADMARLVWRKQNLRTLRIAELAQKNWSDAETSIHEYDDLLHGITVLELDQEQEEQKREELQVAQDRVRKELGDTFELVEIDDASFDGLTEELDIKERLDAAIAAASSCCW